MSCEFFTKVNFQAKTLSIDQANAIPAEYADQGFTLTLRQLFYEFVARMIIENSVAEYGRLGRTMTDARRAGLVDWEYIEDRTRDLETFPSWDSPANIVREAAQQYREDLWLNQQYRPEVWIEKAALIGVIKPACERWRVSQRGGIHRTQSFIWLASGSRTIWTKALRPSFSTLATTILPAST